MPGRLAQKHSLYFELAKLLAAGFDIRKAAGSILGRDASSRDKHLLARLEAGLAAGKSIADAFAESFPEISRLERAMIAAGERSGRMAQAFGFLASYFKSQAAMRRTIARGMLYPAFLLHLGVLVGTAAPRFLQGDSLPDILPSVITTLLCVYALSLLVFFGTRALQKIASDNAAIDRIMNRLPWVGPARRSMAMARFTMIYHAGILAALSMKETIRAAADASESGEIRAASNLLLKTAESGNPLGPAVIATKAFPSAFAHSYATAEESGTLDVDLEHWSQYFTTEAEQRMASLGAAIPRLVYALVVLYVGWKVFAFFAAYYGNMLKIMEGS